jgi:hypothetical protein
VGAAAADDDDDDDGVPDHNTEDHPHDEDDSAGDHRHQGDVSTAADCTDDAYQTWWQGLRITPYVDGIFGRQPDLGGAAVLDDITLLDDDVAVVGDGVGDLRGDVADLGGAEMGGGAAPPRLSRHDSTKMGAIVEEGEEEEEEDLEADLPEEVQEQPMFYRPFGFGVMTPTPPGKDSAFDNALIVPIA